MVTIQLRFSYDFIAASDRQELYFHHDEKLAGTGEHM